MAACDPVTDTWIEARFYQGFPSARYCRRYRRFRKHPTRFAPPLPSESPAIVLVVRVGGNSKTITRQFEPTQVIASELRGVTIGPHRFEFGVDRSIQLTLQGISLKYMPRSASPLRLVGMQLPAIEGETHRWLLADTLGDVTGTVEIAGSPRNFAGIGFFDQQYGTAPPDHLRRYSFRNNNVVIFPPSINAGQSADIRAYGLNPREEIAIQKRY
jgi:hypothetical protein